MSDNPEFAQIQQEIDSNDIVLFMKGTPVFPQCGFSAALVQALTLLGVKFKGVDVLQTRVQLFHSFTSKANSLAAVISCAKCTKMANWPNI